MKNILAEIWKLNFKGENASLEGLKKKLPFISNDIDRVLLDLVKKGYIFQDSNGYRLSEEGREEIKVVVCGGVFDILHPGHAFILERAKSRGDVLVVIVARDSTVEKRKRIPIVSEEQRVEMVGHLKPVDLGILGYQGDPLKIIQEIRPDFIALGPDQHHNEEGIKKELSKRGLDVDVVRIEEFKECALNSTEAILQKIIERNYIKSGTG